ncbi:hypothetical protein [Kriegella aquimaris]|uniref:Uncharacterized protein n=1 Tax=Kriegella aquimaris TaxID=192904 RepID=A0A1G9UGM9_9FLAO|nr:hypothetical protein [Kriegella aquimaris]SDM58705.1 hypothetical protein SAMN04488514_11111 [Kriegella aquimaris]
MDYTIFYVLGGVLLAYLLISMNSRRKSKDRKSRKFMEGYRSTERKNDGDKKAEN